MDACYAVRDRDGLRDGVADFVFVWLVVGLRDELSERVGLIVGLRVEDGERELVAVSDGVGVGVVNPEGDGVQLSVR